MSLEIEILIVNALTKIYSLYKGAKDVKALNGTIKD